MSPNCANFLLLSMLILCFIIGLNALHPRRVYAYQREVVREERRPAVDSDSTAHLATTMVPMPGSKRRDYLICDNGKPLAGICVCAQGFVGKYCERQMHCRDYSRAENGSCIECAENFAGPNCDEPICQNGGTQLENGAQSCQCAAPYSGPFCSELRMEDVYYFYNTKAAIIGPLGILLIVPMIICFYVCEKHARRRQVNRIQRSWAHEDSKKLDQKRIEGLLV